MRTKKIGFAYYNIRNYYGVHKEKMDYEALIKEVNKGVLEKNDLTIERRLNNLIRESNPDILDVLKTTTDEKVVAYIFEINPDLKRFYNK